MPRNVVSPASLSEAIDRLSTYPDQGLTVLDRRGRPGPKLPYPELARRALGWSAWLSGHGLQPGQVVLLCLPTSLPLVEGFLGAVAGGVLPCNLALPRAIGGLSAFCERVRALLGRFQGSRLVTTADVAAELAKELDEDLQARIHVAPEDPLAQGQAELRHPASVEALAYVQLTSGSTQVPKAVSITHANAAANTHAIYVAGKGNEHERDALVSWLPLYHDMGLAGILLTSLAHGIDLTLMTPESFVATPLRWLQAISNQPARVITSAPNFGYQWCVDRIAPGKEEGLDLSRLEMAICGAEMIRPGTLDAFAERFGKVGFRRAGFMPSYGMAETTLAVTMSPFLRGPRIKQGYVGCGVAVPGLEVRIEPPRDPDELRPPPAGATPLPPLQEGEVVVRGTSVFPGYYLEPEQSALVLDPEGDFWTGDLGFLDEEGELYITGRSKDVIVLDGHNVAPHELEWLAQEHLPMEGGRAAAFAIEVQDERRERPVLVVEVKTAPADESAMEAVKKAAAREVAPLHDLVLVRRGSLPKTSSGKVRRGKVKQDYLAGRLDAVLWQSKSAEGTKS